MPGYLGRVLDADGAPAGTCFQVVPGVLVTACHVLDDIGAGAVVAVDPLAGGPAFEAAVRRVDRVHDLAVLSCAAGLPGAAGPLTATDEMALRCAVAVTGHCVLEDPGRTARSLTAVGQWAGAATWQDAVPVGRMNADAVLPGMSGAPVIREGDGAVAGVVSGRYNTADGWLAGTVWVARTEDLEPLLDGLADVIVERAPLAGPVDLVVAVAGDGVRLTGLGIDVSAAHGGVRAGLAGAVQEARRARAVATSAQRAPGQAAGHGSEVSLARAGRLLGESFLPPALAAVLGRELERADRAHQPVRLGLAVDAGLGELPWEALTVPGDHRPLVLDPLVRFYRKTAAGPGRVLAGPLRIVIAIAAPDDGGGPVLDYERELRDVVAAVRAARQDAADVRVVPFATPAAIFEELDRGTAHVLHVSGHGLPGRLDLEDDDGSARPVSAEQFLREAVPAGKMPPVIVLAACYTDAAAQGGASFAAELCAHGAAAVIGTETSVTDTYATRLLARVYGELARTGDADVVAALADARRRVQAELENSPDRRDNELAGLGEWAAVSVLAASGSVPVLDPAARPAAASVPSRPRIAGLADRDDWYFVGRRAEQRRWPADLVTGTATGIVVCGIGGTGKTTLAAQLAARVHGQDRTRVLASLAGPLTLEGLFGQLISMLRRDLLVRGQDGSTVAALDAAARTDLGWADRWAILRGHVLDHVPVLMVLDNFEDNLKPDGDAGYAVRDEALAGLLAAWVTDPGAARLLITSRYQFTLPDGAQQYLSFRQLGPLSRAETMKLAWSLPALDKLSENQLGQVWRLAGGHPRSLEYLDALLSGGTARYPDVTARLHAAVSRRLHCDSRESWLAARTSLDAALAEAITLAADDVLLGGLLDRLAQIPGAVGLLLGISVYREPVDTNAVLFQAGPPDPAAAHTPDRRAAVERITGILAGAGITVDDTFDMAAVPGPVQALLAPHMAELNRPPSLPVGPVAGLAGLTGACQEASLLTITGTDTGQRFFVHRWTATELAGRQAGPQLDHAHQRAAAYWQWRARAWPQDKPAYVHDLLEARHHLLHASDPEGAGQVTEQACDQLHAWGAWDQETSLIHDTLTRLPPDSPRRVVWIHQLGILAQARGDYDEAARQYQRSLDINKRLGDQAGLATGYHQLGRLAEFRGDYDEAARQYQRALDIDERLGDQAGVASSYHQLGMIAHLRGDYDEAARQYQRALDIKERLGDQAGTARSYGQLGILAQDRGDYDEAARLYQRALDIFERLGNQVGMASSYHQLGMIAHDRGDYDDAARQYQRALDIDERLGNQAGMAATYHQLGMIAHDRGDYDDAARQYQRALDISERLGNQASMASTYSQLGILEAERGGDAGASVSRHVQALAIRLGLGVPQAAIDLRRLATHRTALSAGSFTRMLTEAAGAGEAQKIVSLLDQLEAADSRSG